MNERSSVDSPFMKVQVARLSFTTLLIMLLTVVGAGIGLLIFYALRVPAITAELNAWLGWSSPVADTGQGRAAQVVFILFVYTAPLGLGIVVYFLHYLVSWLDHLNRARESAEDEPFRMS
jgi:sterol desaturase/sphingolipid hydroxylase (fatty acid hydroxylase superfamily)